MRRARGNDSRLRVLTLARDAGSGYGGAERIAFELAGRIDSTRFKSYLCTTRVPPISRMESVAADRLQLEAAGIEVLSLERSSSRSVAPWRHLYRLMARERIDILHAHMPRASVPGAILARLARVPVVISHEHGSALEGKLGRRLLDRNVVARLSNLMLAVSDWDRRNLIELEGIPADRVGVLPNGIISPPQEGPDLRPELGIPAQARLVGAVGRLYPEKAYDDLIRAIALLKDRFPLLLGVVVGDGPLEKQLRGLIDELGLDDHVRLLGRREDVPDVIRALDVAVLPSRREGSPLAVIEYMAAARPIVATNVGGVPELVHDGVHALLVPTGDPPSLAAGIERLLTDHGLAARLGTAARERQRNEYELDVIVERLQALYVELSSA